MQMSFPVQKTFILFVEVLRVFIIYVSILVNTITSSSLVGYLMCVYCKCLRSLNILEISVLLLKEAARKSTNAITRNQ